MTKPRTSKQKLIDLSVSAVYHGDSAEMLKQIPDDMVALSFWSPPYHVGKAYERGQSYEEWQTMLKNVIEHHAAILKPGGFCVINIADILCFADENMPRIMAETHNKQRIQLTREEVLKTAEMLGTTDRRKIGAHLGVSEQTVDRRIKGNNIRGGKYDAQTRTKLVGGMIEDWAMSSGLYVYDRRIWVKDPAWANSRWHTSSLRAIDEFEYLYVLWKPGPTKVDKGRLTRQEWIDWGSRAVWNISSVRRNDYHEAMFPIELPTRVVRLFSDPGEVVLDPFVGSGTTIEAAVSLNRVGIGIDKEAKYALLARKRLQKVVADLEP
jgi:DNA modification methylase